MPRTPRWRRSRRRASGSTSRCRRPTTRSCTRWSAPWSGHERRAARILAAALPARRRVHHPIAAMALRRRLPGDRVLGRPRRGGRRAAPTADPLRRRSRPLRRPVRRLAVLLRLGRGAARPGARPVQGVLHRRQREAGRRARHHLPLHLGRPRLRPDPGLDPGLPQEAGRGAHDAQLRPRLPGRGPHLRRHAHGQRPAAGRGHGQSRPAERRRPHAQRPASGQPPPFPAPGGGPLARSGGRRAGAGPLQQPLRLPDPPGSGHAGAIPRAGRGAPRAGAAEGRQGLPLPVRLHRRRPRDDPGMSPAALVTGGGSGIGAAVARRLAADGYGVVVPGRRLDPLAQVAAEIGGIAAAGDCGDPAGAETAVRTAVEELGGLDALVYCAGVSHSGSVVDQTPESWDAVLRTNLTGAFLTARAALPHLEQRGGSLVAVSSLAGLRAGPDSSAYCASKAGLNMLVQSIAVDFGSRGVRANAVCPGWIRTPMADGAMDELAGLHGTDREGAYRLAHARMPTPRAGEVEEVAGLVAWLLSPAAAYVNGTVIPVDGGVSVLDLGLMEFRT